MMKLIIINDNCRREKPYKSFYQKTSVLLIKLSISYIIIL